MTLAIPARMLRAAWIVVLVCACVAGPVLAADAGWLAYERGDYAAARNFYDAAARAGDRLAQYNLAMMLMRGEGGTADAGAGVVWLRRAADAGMAQAQYNLGLLFESGVGVPRSLTSATTWWEKAAEQGHADAQVQLATQYFLGRGAPKDWKLAARWYEAAAGNGDAGAQYIIGSFYEHGDGVAQDLRKALDWYEKALTRLSQETDLRETAAETYSNVAYKLYEEKKHSECKPFLDRAIELKPDYTFAYNLRGITYANLKEYQRASNDYSRSHELDPTSISAAWNSSGKTSLLATGYETSLAMSS